MTFSAPSSALHPESQLLWTLISLLASSTSPTASHALHYSLHSPPSHLPLSFLLLLLLLGSPSEIQEFSLSSSSFPPIGGCLIINFSISLSVPWYLSHLSHLSETGRGWAFLIFRTHIEHQLRRLNTSVSRSSCNNTLALMRRHVAQSVATLHWRTGKLSSPRVVTVPQEISAREMCNAILQTALCNATAVVCSRLLQTTNSRLCACSFSPPKKTSGKLDQDDRGPLKPI